MYAQEFKVNDYLSLKLEEGRTVLYVKGERFSHCKSLLLEVPVNEISALDEIESIDEAAARLDDSLGGNENATMIPPEVEFWGHCSNLQVWAEYGYDTQLLHSNLAFPLLKKLVEAGDPAAKNVFKEEIARRLESGYPSVVEYLIEEDYFDYLSPEEKSNIKFWKKLGVVPKELEFLNDLKLSIGKEIPLLTGFKATFHGFPLGILIKEGHIVALGLKNQGLEELPDSIGNLNSIEIIDLTGNQLKSLPESFGKLGNLKYLALSHNKLTGLPESIGNLHSLTNMYLEYNMISSLPESIGKLEKLAELIMEQNNVKALPQSIGNLNHLRTLSLEENDLETLPETIGNLRSLTSLDLSGNLLTSIPSSIGNLRSLDSLNLSFNQLTFLPESIGNLLQLDFLDASHNQLTFLPESLGNLKIISQLYLGENKIVKLPNSLQYLTSLKTIELDQITIEANKEILEKIKEGASIWEYEDLSHLLENH